MKCIFKTKGDDLNFFIWKYRKKVKIIPCVFPIDAPVTTIRFQKTVNFVTNFKVFKWCLDFLFVNIVD